MNFPPFFGPWLKISRACEHIHNLDQFIYDFEHNVKAEFYLNGDKEHGWRIKLLGEPSLAIPLLIGDIAHSLRSSLDLGMCDIADIRGCSRSDIKFPFAGDADSFNRKVAGRNQDEPWKKLGQDVVDFITSLKPYKGGNETLRLLHDLNIQDKHRFIVPAAYFISTTRNQTAMFRKKMDINAIVIGGTLVAHDIDDAIMDYDFFEHPSDSITINEHVTRLKFAEGTIGEKHTIRPVIFEMLEETKSTLTDLGRLVGIDPPS
jgi:hypothetical protein